MKIDLTDIKNIIFDLGRVLLNLDFEASINAFKELGLQTNVLDNKQAYSDSVFYEFEVGKISPKEFCNRVRVVLYNPDESDWLIENAWSSIILDMPEHRLT